MGADLTYYFLESVIALGLIWIGLQVVAIALWSWLRTPFTGRLAVVGLVLGPALLLVSHLVETDREQVTATCEQLADWVEGERAAAIEYAVSSRFEAEDIDRESLRELLERMFARYDINYPELHNFDVTFPDNDNSVATFNAGCRVASSHFGSSWLPTRWEVSFERSQERWLVTGVRTIPIPPLNLKSLRDIGR
ncbi:MAG: hypothetical protein ACYTHJ_09420 [Planctomycetota bacterium]|jgi:hypothetical protein